MTIILQMNSLTHTNDKLPIYYAYESRNMNVKTLINYLQEIEKKFGNVPVTISASIDPKTHNFEIGIPQMAIDVNINENGPILVLHQIDT